MTRIKCRYSIPYCDYGGFPSRVEHDEYWFCDTDALCADYLMPENPTVENPTCRYCFYEPGEFEKTVKSYEYSDGDLKIGRNVYLESEIIYLEIDGRVLVDENTEEE